MALRLDRTLGPGVVRWIETNLVHGPGDIQGQRVELDDEQVRFIVRAYQIDGNGRRTIRRAVYSRSKGRAKSELLAFIACAEALGPVRFRGWDHDGRPLGGPIRAPLIRLAATEEGQAGNTFGPVEFMLREGAISATPGLDVGMTRVFLPDGGKIVPVTAKAASKDGGLESFVGFDETHLYVLPEHHRLHSTIRRNLGKRKDAQPWSMETSTMYAPGEGSVAEHSHAYYKAIRAGQLKDAGFLFDHRQATSDFDFDDDGQLRSALLEAYGEAGAWIDTERLIAEARDPQTDRNDFVRYFLNQPTRRERAQWIKAGAWDACGDGKEVENDALVALGADGSRKFDTTVVAWASRADDGRIDVDCRIFSVREGAPHHVLHEGGQINFEDVEDFIVDRFDVFQVQEAAYDPRYLDRSAELIVGRLPEARIVVVEPQSKHMRAALTAFERGVIEGIVRHRGDKAIGEHVDWAGVDRGESDEVRRVFKIDRRRPIDAAVAMALAYWRVSVSDLAPSEPLFAWA